MSCIAVDSQPLRLQYEQYIHWRGCRYVIVYEQYVIESAFQPIFDHKCRLLGYEALIRPQCNGQWVSPVDLLASFRNSGNMTFIDRLFRIMHFRNYALLPDRADFLFINYELDSIINVEDNEVFHYLQQQRFAEPGLSNTQLVLEILEHKTHSEEHLALMTEWRRAVEGVCLALDDAQDDELTRIRTKNIRPDIVKIDRLELFSANYSEFIAELKTMGATLVQEGIETQEQLAKAQKAGIQWFQGFLLARPKLIANYL